MSELSRVSTITENCASEPSINEKAAGSVLFRQDLHYYRNQISKGICGATTALRFIELDEPEGFTPEVKAELGLCFENIERGKCTNPAYSRISTHRS